MVRTLSLALVVFVLAAGCRTGGLVSFQEFGSRPGVAATVDAAVKTFGPPDVSAEIGEFTIVGWRWVDGFSLDLHRFLWYVPVLWSTYKQGGFAIVADQSGSVIATGSNEEGFALNVLGTQTEPHVLIHDLR